jgi:hypothetical protein
MTKRSKFERAKRAAETVRVQEIERDWKASVPAADAAEFARLVAAARERGPAPKPADMAPGTMPNPPRPGREPKPKKDDDTKRRRY